MQRYLIDYTTLLSKKNAHAPPLKCIEVGGFGSRRDPRSQYARLRFACHEEKLRLRVGDGHD